MIIPLHLHMGGELLYPVLVNFTIFQLFSVFKVIQMFRCLLLNPCLSLCFWFKSEHSFLCYLLYTTKHPTSNFSFSDRCPLKTCSQTVFYTLILHLKCTLHNQSMTIIFRFHKIKHHIIISCIWATWRCMLLMTVISVQSQGKNQVQA